MLKIAVMMTVLFLLASVRMFAVDNEMIKVPGGTFMIGSTSVTVSPFSISKFDITQIEWTSVMGTNPSYFNTNVNNPVEQVSWYDGIVYCNKRSIKEGLTPVYSIRGSTDPSTWGVVPKFVNSTWDAVIADWEADGYRLPTEMEWMWAAMGADTENPGQVNTNGYKKAFAGSTGKNKIEDYAWVSGFSGTHPAGTKLPNELGIYDLSGNVWQRCWDWYKPYYPGGALTNYHGGALGMQRVTRGGSWGNRPSFSAVANRDKDTPDSKDRFMGLRVVKP